MEAKKNGNAPNPKVLTTDGKLRSIYLIQLNLGGPYLELWKLFLIPIHVRVGKI